MPTGIPVTCCPPRYAGGDVEAQGSSPNTPTGVPYTDDEIIGIARRDKQQGHIPVLVGFWRDTAGTSSLYPSLDARTPPMSISGSGEGGDGELGEDEDADGDEDS
nr:hypothetical protein [Tanacetum cinerariifolium]